MAGNTLERAYRHPESAALAVTKRLFSLVKNGGRTWARTKDPLIKSQLLYQLSYASALPFSAKGLVCPPIRLGSTPYSGCFAELKGKMGAPVGYFTRTNSGAGSSGLRP